MALSQIDNSVGDGQAGKCVMSSDKMLRGPTIIMTGQLSLTAMQRETTHIEVMIEVVDTSSHMEVVVEDITQGREHIENVMEMKEDIKGIDARDRRGAKMTMLMLTKSRISIDREVRA